MWSTIVQKLWIFNTPFIEKKSHRSDFRWNLIQDDFVQRKCVSAYSNTSALMRDRVWIGSTRVHLFSMLLVWFRTVNIDEWAATDSTKNSNTQSTLRTHNAIPIYLFYRAPSVPFFKFTISSLNKSVWKFTFGFSFFRRAVANKSSGV